MTMRTFVSAYRFDPVRVLLVRRVLPVLVWISLLGALLVPVLILRAFWDEVAAAERLRLLWPVAGIGALLLTAPAVLQWCLWLARRELFETTWHVYDWGFERRRGRAVARRRWGEVARLDRLGIGRVQLARVRSPAGNLWFDAAVIEVVAQPPTLRWGMAQMTIRYADGRERPLSIDTCELYLAIAGRLAADR